METTMKIEGMMCPHCEANVKKGLEAIEGVEEAKVSHETGSAVVIASASIEDGVLKKTVEDLGYKVVE
jgi:Cu2+-exporting ATPase